MIQVLILIKNNIKGFKEGNFVEFFGNTSDEKGKRIINKKIFLSNFFFKEITQIIDYYIHDYLKKKKLLKEDSFWSNILEWIIKLKSKFVS